MLGERGRRIELSADMSGSRLLMYDNKNRTRNALGVNDDSGALLVMSDDKEEPRVLLNGSPMLKMYDESQRRTLLQVREDGPGLTMSDSQGNLRTVLNVGKDGPMLRMYDDRRRPRTGVLVTEDGPSIVLLDDAGKARWSAP